MTATPTHDAEISAVLDALELAWAAGDWSAFAALHWEDATYVAFDGTLMLGRQGIAAGHRPLFEGIMRGSRLVTLDRMILDVGTDTAIVVQRAGIIMRWQRQRNVPSRKRLSTATTVLERRGGEWRVRAFHNTRFRPWVSTAAGRLFAPRAEQPTSATLAA